MTAAWRLGGLVAVVTLVTGCLSPRPERATAPRDLIVLAVHPEGEALGAAVVTAAGVAVNLAEARAATSVVAGRAPSVPTVLSADEVTRLFGEALAALPPPARRFVLYFDLGTDTLTPESQALVPAILAVVAERGQPDVAITGHTDTTGAPVANVALGLRRASLVRDRLVSAGLGASLIEVVSHGEANLLEPTPDNTEHARNRRVEVTVR